MGNAEISREEFDRLYHTLEQGFEGVHSRLDKLNGSVSEHKAKIAVLEAVGVKVSDPSARWGAFGAVIAAIVTGAWAYFTK